MHRMVSGFHMCDKEINLVTLWSHFYDNTILLCKTVYLCLCAICMLLDGLFLCPTRNKYNNNCLFTVRLAISHPSYDRSAHCEFCSLVMRDCDRH